MAEFIPKSALLAKLKEESETEWVGSSCEHRDIRTGIRMALVCVENFPAVDAVEVFKRTEEIEKAICVLNVYRNTYYKEPSGTVKYAVADAINTILPLFARCLERRTDNAVD